MERITVFGEALPGSGVHRYAEDGTGTILALYFATSVRIYEADSPHGKIQQSP
jgi:hypothetical protein